VKERYFRKEKGKKKNRSHLEKTTMEGKNPRINASYRQRKKKKKRGGGGPKKELTYTFERVTRMRKGTAKLFERGGEGSPVLTT